MCLEWKVYPRGRDFLSVSSVFCDLKVEDGFYFSPQTSVSIVRTAKVEHSSQSLVLDNSEQGVVITGITEDTAAKSGLRAGDEIAAATIHLDHLNKMKCCDSCRPWSRMMTT
ncbi:hypothetical protein KUCAC02_023909 [Chaenocephalus aceratus]|uniref:Uncharacterized protein n=1 Tax=Chaenocephalus aceratus TaxID=36190 RepID=A0ACB9WGL4_CHAAC|nr:hypothetical protein KUCAC02_023909 [Chaenocephalus aceratus]